MLGRFAPGSNELCTYTLPEGDGASDYVIFPNGRTGCRMSYQLPPGAAPYGMMTDSDNVWLADQGSDGGPRFQFLG
jgi:streptogramin lyase